MATRVTGLFRDEAKASDAFAELVEQEFDPQEIAVVRYESGRATEVPVEHHTGVPAGLGVGVALGALIGAIVAGSLAELSAGQGALAGALFGGIVGALGGLAFWWKQPDLEPFGEGDVLVGVTTGRRRAPLARGVLARCGAARVLG
jgi:hypothetical protein